jgi:uridine kinase
MEINDIVNAIKANNKPHYPILIAIEGFGGSGKSTLANKLSELLGKAFVISMDDFIIKENFTKNSWDNQVFDRDRLERQVLEPALKGKSISYQKVLWNTDDLSVPISVPNVKYLIIEGISSFHPTIAKYYDFKIWVDTPIEIAKLRGILRDGENDNEKYWDIWTDNDVAYQRKYHSDQVADFTVSNK